ncbi:MAG: hypothetical protein CVU43_00695 [Chloroflexi bacterium HGW-Chloroflexi-5]|jgi:hypothetical protein|nr:MAG: hypothetical protein CVU43_00695 [Chloroflexi bacterium HGW-Chloroflexi-5]
MLQLNDWSKRLDPYYKSGLRIIGEIPLTWADINELADIVHAVFVAEGMKRGSDILYYEYPKLMLTLMACFAAHNTKRDYWQAFADFIEVDKVALYNQRWHHCFVELAESEGFKVFKFKDDPTPYVTSIRFQGGIPTYSLPDYFEKMVLPAVQRPDLREIPTKQALAYLLNHAYFVDSPVLDFLRNSGELGIEFFSDSCKLARHALKHHGEILPLGDLNLPSYIVSAFETYFERQVDEKQHWRKPELLAAPYSDDAPVILSLPEQEINLDLFTRQIQWQIVCDDQDQPIILPCKVFRQRQSVVTKEVFQPIQETPKTIIVSLLAVYEETSNVQELRRWNLSLIPSPDRTPIMAFREDRKLVSQSIALPAEPLYLVIPKDCQFTFTGNAILREEFSALSGYWSGWKIEAWDLSGAWSLQLSQNEKLLGRVIPIQGIITQPQLTGGHLFQFQNESSLPLYTTELPSLKIPTTFLHGDQADLNAWQVRVRSKWDAVPSIDVSFKLGQFRSVIQIEKEMALFPLSTILEKESAGTFEVELRGPRDIHLEFRFHFWPSILVCGHSLKIGRPDHDPKSSQFILRLPDKARCEPQAGAEAATITRNPAGWMVTAPETANRVMLDLTMPSDNGGLVRVPIMIPMPKLRWGLATDQDQGILELNQNLLTRSIDQLLQAGNCSLHVEMYGLGDILESLRIRLVEDDKPEQFLQEVKLTRTNFTKDWLRVTLGQFSDSIKNIHSLAQFELIYWTTDREADPIRIPLIELSRDLSIDHVKLDQVTDTTWKISWKEEHTLRNRRVMIVPSWQPWQKPWEYIIPDNSNGELLIENIALPPSQYELYFYISPKWATTKLEQPKNIKPFLCKLCTPVDRLEALDGKGKTPNEHFKNLVEMANIQDSLGEYKQRDIRLSECAKFLTQLSDLNLLLGSLQWIQSKEIDPPVKSFFLRSMYRIEILGTILRSYNLYDPDVIDYLEYTNKVKDIPTDSAKLMLKRVDNPTAIHSAFHSLLKKKDSELISLVIKMMEESRISKRDALDLFCNDVEWVIAYLETTNSNIYSDSLLAGLLPKIANSPTMVCNSNVSELMVRSLPHEDEPEIVKSYLHCLVSENHPQAFGLLMNCFSNKLISDEDVFEFLSQNPIESLEILEKAPKHENHASWISRLIEEFPGAAGIIRPGDKLKTPFGLVKIDTIIHNQKGSQQQIRLGEPESQLNVVLGDGGERIRLVLDFEENKVMMESQKTVWKCGNCGFIHPDYKVVSNHYKANHPQLGMRFEQVNLPIYFDKENIEIL